MYVEFLTSFCYDLNAQTSTPNSQLMKSWHNSAFPAPRVVQDFQISEICQTANVYQSSDAEAAQGNASEEAKK